MFTGLIQDIGKIEKIESNAEGKKITVSSKLCSQIKIDDSVAINGVCQTAIDVNDKTFSVQAVHVSLSKTSLGELKAGAHVNLELALRPIDRLGGHFVQGHVNGVGKVVRIENKGSNYLVWFSVPKEIQKYIILEGSITLNGISLTIADISDGQYQVSIIPHTWNQTTFSSLKVGSTLNIEVDVLAKYVESFLKTAQSSKVNMEWLKEKGFL